MANASVSRACLAVDHWEIKARGEGIKTVQVLRWNLLGETKKTVSETINNSIF